MEKTRVGELLARNMKRCREILHLSQEQLAEKVGCATTTIGRIESQSRFPSAAYLDRIAAALGIHPSELFMEDSAAIEAMRSKYEVRDRLEKGMRAAIDEALGEDLPRAASGKPSGRRKPRS